MNRHLVVLILVALVLIAVGGAVALRSTAVTPGSRARADASSARSTPRQDVVTLEVGGMTCAGCVDKIEKQLSSTPGVATVTPRPAEQRFIVVVASSVDDTTLTAAVRRAGHGYLGMVVER